MMEEKPTTETPAMNNNPIKLLFELGGATITAITEYKRRGLLVLD